MMKEKEEHQKASLVSENCFGLSDTEMEALGRLFSQATENIGIDGRRIFETLAQGRSFGEALKVPEGVMELLYARAHHWFSAGHFTRAEALFRTLCLLDGASADYWIGYGVTLRIRENWKSARIAFEVAARLRPQWAAPHFHLLELFMRCEEWGLARKVLSSYDDPALEGRTEFMRHEVERFRTALELRGMGLG